MLEDIPATSEKDRISHKSMCSYCAEANKCHVILHIGITKVHKQDYFKVKILCFNHIVVFF